MKEWAYIAKLNGDTYTSSLMAQSAEDVVARLERMNFKDIVVNDVAQTRAQIDSAKQASADQGKNLSNMIEGLAQDVHNTSEGARAVISGRRESIVFGDKTALLVAEKHLVANGTVKHAIMRPDHTGKMSFLFVIEHDIGG